MGDMEKAFLNIEIDKRDRDCLRFLWCKDVHKPDIKIVVYRFCRVMFGLNERQAETSHIEVQRRRS